MAVNYRFDRLTTATAGVYGPHRVSVVRATNSVCQQQSAAFHQGAVDQFSC